MGRARALIFVLNDRMVDHAETDTLFKPYLLADEHLVWSGRPLQGIVFRSADIVLVPFSLFWGAGVAYVSLMTWSSPFSGSADEYFIRLWAMPFVLVGLYFVFGRFIHDAAIRKRLAYAVSNQRVMVFRPRKFKSFDIRRLPKLQLAEYRNGAGTITFEQRTILDYLLMLQMGSMTPSLDAHIRFYRISEPRRVYEIIQAQLHGQNSDIAPAR